MSKECISSESSRALENPPHETPLFCSVLDGLCNDVMIEILSYLSLGDVLSIQTVSSSFREIASDDRIYRHLCQQRWNYFRGHANISLQDLYREHESSSTDSSSHSSSSWESLLKKLSNFRVVDQFLESDGPYTGFDTCWKIRSVFLDEQEEFDTTDGRHPRNPDSERHICQYAHYLRNNYYIPCHIWVKNEFRFVPDDDGDKNKNKHGFVVRFSNSGGLMGQTFGLLGLNTEGMPGTSTSIRDSLDQNPGHNVFFPDSTRESFGFVPSVGAGPTGMNYGVIGMGGMQTRVPPSPTHFRYWGFDLLGGKKVRDAQVGEKQSMRAEYCDSKLWQQELGRRIHGRDLVTLGCCFDLGEKTISFSVGGHDLGVAFRDVDAKSVVPVFYVFSDDYYELLCVY